MRRLDAFLACGAAGSSGGRSGKKFPRAVDFPAVERRRGGDEPREAGPLQRGTTMKYVLMYTSRPDLAAGDDPEAAQLIYKRVYEWFGENAGVMADSGAELLGVETATTVRHGSDGAVVVDGPFNEAKEIIGGFSVIDVADMDAAIAVVKHLAPARPAGCGGRDPADGRGLRPVRVTARDDRTADDDHGRPPRADGARGGRSAGGPAVASLRGLRPRRGGRPGRGGSRRWRRGGAMVRPTTRAPGSRSRPPATRWTGCATATASARSPRVPDPRPAEGPGRRPAPTTGSPSSSPAATPPSRRRPGSPSPSERSWVSPPRR